MNKEWVIENLKSAVDELNNTIANIEGTNPEQYSEFPVTITRIYHHINTAWNSQNETDDEISFGAGNYQKWRLFPKDVNMDANTCNDVSSALNLTLE